MFIERRTIETPDGWKLQIRRGIIPGRTPGLPVLFVPGYGMNSTIFSYHPNSQSFMETLLDAGLDPWCIDPRGTSTSARAPRGGGEVSLARQAFVDLPTAFDFICDATGRQRIHAIGCSLGGALLYAYGSGVTDHRIDRVVTMGTPFHWTTAPPLVRAFSRLEPILRHIRVRGTRRLAGLALPIARNIPGLLDIYLNPKLTKTRPAAPLVSTVEDPHQRVNHELAGWIRNGHLRLDGFHLDESSRNFDRPLFLVYAAEDGICPPAVSLAAVSHVSGPVEVLRIDHPTLSVTHVDLFISDLAPVHVYPPIVGWLKQQAASSDPMK